MRCRYWALGAMCVCVASCSSPTSDPSRPSGLRNMAPLPPGETILEDLDVEPNDTFLQAVDISLSGDEMRFMGTLTVGDIDTWRIKAKAGTIVDIEVAPEGFDVIVDFSPIDKDSGRRFYDSKPANEAEVLTNIRLTPQGGFLTVRGRNEETVRYVVTIRRRMTSAGTILEEEPNDTVSMAQMVVGAQKIEGTTNPAGDVDFFRLSVTGPSYVECQFSGKASEMMLMDGTKTLWSGVAAAGSPLRSAVFGSSDVGIFLRIQGLDALEDVASYTCQVSAAESLSGEIEPNDTIEQAQLIQDISSPLDFTFSSSSDVDFFRIRQGGASALAYSVRVTAASGVGPRLQILTPAGVPRDQVVLDGATACGFTVSPGEDFFVRVSHDGTAPNYPAGYQLAFSTYSASEIEREPNQTLATAQPVLFGTRVLGHIFPSTDVDVYRIEVPSVPGVTDLAGKIAIVVDPGYIAQLSLKVQDSEGYEIAQSASVHFSRPMHLAFDAPHGVYYVVVSGAGDGCVKPYAMTVTFTANEAATIPIDQLIDAARQTDTAERQPSSNTGTMVEEIPVVPAPVELQVPPSVPAPQPVPGHPAATDDDEDAF